MITDKDYRNISEDVYEVDSLKDSPTPPIEGEVVADKKIRHPLPAPRYDQRYAGHSGCSD